ncbi:MAG: DUF72 domain-containing protein [Promethearchaeota archaeon]|jgi:uncharacterized protein YecE (DUF72 family)
MIYLGTSGWYYNDWIGPFYPNNILKNEWLKYYCTKFNSVEVNASFYRLPYENMINSWFKKTPNNFLLSFKGDQFITHKKKLKNVSDYLAIFLNRIKIVKNKLGVILWQLPPKLRLDLILLENFLKLLDPELRHCIEFRNEDWFIKEVFHLLRAYNVAFCIISAPKLPSIYEVTTDFAYIRWHGLSNWYQYDYSKNELEKWAKIIKDLNVKDVFGYFNNDFNAKAPQNCTILKELLKQ